MATWCIKLREDELGGWSWHCYDRAGRFLCRSRQAFRQRWQALRDFEHQLEDHIAVMQTNGRLNMI